MRVFRNEILALLLLNFGMFGFLGVYTLDSAGKGLYFGMIFLGICLISKFLRGLLIKKVFPLLIFFNLIIVLFNLYFQSNQIEPLFSKGGFDKESSVIRAISLFGYEPIFHRPTGISENLHVTGLLLLSGVYYYDRIEKNILKWIAIFAMLISFNLQITISFVLWNIAIKFKKLKLKTTLYAIGGFVLLFIFMDQLFLDGWYLYMVLNTLESGYYKELSEYANFASVEHIFFGIAPWHMSYDPYDTFTTAIPLTDFGLIGFPIQHGLYGVVSTLFLLWTFFLIGDRKFQVFLFSCCFMIVHYFPLVSFLGVLVLSSLSFLKFPLSHSHKL